MSYTLICGGVRVKDEALPHARRQDKFRTCLLHYRFAEQAVAAVGQCKNQLIPVGADQPPGYTHAVIAELCPPPCVRLPLMQPHLYQPRPLGHECRLED
jgi:hypothetical protein